MGKLTQQEKPVNVDGTLIYQSLSHPNPNGTEFDNLYLDMNGIVHPCTHPEDKPPPANEDEMMIEIFKYTERIINMVRPRKLLMIALDGVAPRAKMNQQRSRRFRAALDTEKKEADLEEFIKLLKASGKSIDKTLEKKKIWDSNVITPGTPFMDILAKSLKYWIIYKINSDPAWKDLKVIISDASVPGEGEHKIMEFIRGQRSNPGYDPNTQHVIYGLDADLIMLGLATHEPHFRVLREDVFFQDANSKGCHICGQNGHFARECTGIKKKNELIDEKPNNTFLKPFVWLRIDILREYLEAELNIPNISFQFDLERAIDDWVCLCFFVGNDFLPHLPSLDIHEGAIETLGNIWKEKLHEMGGYLTMNGYIDLKRAEIILQTLGQQENRIFYKRHEAEERLNESNKRRKIDKNNSPQHYGKLTSQEKSPLHNINSKNTNRISSCSKYVPCLPDDLIMLSNKEDIKMITVTNKNAVLNKKKLRLTNNANKDAAQLLKNSINDNNFEKDQNINSYNDLGTSSIYNNSFANTEPRILAKRKADVLDNTPKQNSIIRNNSGDIEDTIRLWEPGFQKRYYEQKFHISESDIESRKKIVKCYIEGTCWVLLYYYQVKIILIKTEILTNIKGCPSWKWYYPYHYAPFASDFKDISSLNIHFDLGEPFKPYEQLMGVLPSASKDSLPKPLQSLMMEDSEIIDFYPKEFPIDMNGKRFTWQGVALLPFIDEERLLRAIEKVYPELSDEEKSRNAAGNDTLFISEGNPLYDDLILSIYSKKNGSKKSIKLNTKLSGGLSGIVLPDENWVPNSTIFSPLTSVSFPDIENDRSLSLIYQTFKTSSIHKSILLPGVKLNKRCLDINDIRLVHLGISAQQKNYNSHSQHYSEYINLNNISSKHYSKAFRTDINPQKHTEMEEDSISMEEEMQKKNNFEEAKRLSIEQLKENFNLDEKKMKQHEEALIKLGELYRDQRKLNELAKLIQESLVFLKDFAKAKTAKIIRTLIDLFSSVPDSLDLQINVTKETINWAKENNRIFLKLSLETRIVGLYMQAKQYAKALQLVEVLLIELKRLDDKFQLVEVYLLESQIYHAIKNIPKARASLTSARTCANAIYCLPHIQTGLDLQSGILHAEERDYNTAYSYFYEAYEGFSASSDPRTVLTIKYMLLCKIMLNASDDVQNFINVKIAQKHAGRDLDAMNTVARAHQNRSLSDFEKALHDFKDGNDPIMHSHLAILYDTLLKQNLSKIIEPFSRVELAHISKLIGICINKIEEKLSQMILDKVFHGILDQAHRYLQFPTFRFLMNRPIPFNPVSTQNYCHTPQQSMQNILGKRPAVSTNETTQPPKAPKPKQRPTDRSIPAKIQTLIPDSKLYHELRDIERRLDAVITRKQFDIQDAINKSSKIKKTLRVFVSNISSDQPWQTTNKKLDHHAFDFDTGAIPTWTLRIEGKLLDDTQATNEKQKFSNFIKSVIVELDRNNRFFPDESIARWHKSSINVEFDGLEIKRRGDMNIDVNILIYLNEYPEKYKLSPKLSQILDMKSETRPEIIMGLWEYIKFHKLQDEEEKRIINCDNNLKEV
ncbi:hypothetical protein PCK1_000374 [Pneumocystis canis]|nr:hypothetical protein PCK1_000374 [Pneumocystis canis]